MASRVALVVLAISAAVICVGAWPTSERIVGGADANVGQFPHQVTLQRDDSSHTCGGSIISELYVLTAAHCVVSGEGIESLPGRFWKVRVGSIQLNAGGQLCAVKRIIVNKSYGNFLNDLALIELETPLTFTDNIQPIELATAEVPSGADVVVSGWGRLYTNGPIPYRMKWNTLKALTTAECEEAIAFGRDSLICLAHEQDNGVCNGDSGGPATYQGKLVGVAGFVVDGCGSKNPDGYAKVSYHLDWILEHMAP